MNSSICFDWAVWQTSACSASSKDNNRGLLADIMKWCWIVYFGRRRRGGEIRHVGAEESRDRSQSWRRRRRRRGGCIWQEQQHPSLPSQQGGWSDPVFALQFYLPGKKKKVYKKACSDRRVPGQPAAGKYKQYEGTYKLSFTVWKRVSCIFTSKLMRDEMQD